MKLNSFEFRRQLFHALLGVVIVLGVSIGLLSAGRLLLIFIGGVVASALSTKYDVPVVSWFLRHFEREKEAIPGKGAMFFVLGSLIVISLFPRGIALASILVLALGDSFATVVGLHLGRVKSITRKTLEGFFAGVFTAFLGAVIFVDVFSALAGSLAAMFFELLEIKLGNRVVDDNLMVPLVAGLVMYVVSLL